MRCMKPLTIPLMLVLMLIFSGCSINYENNDDNVDSKLQNGILMGDTEYKSLENIKFNWYGDISKKNPYLELEINEPTEISHIQKNFALIIPIEQESLSEDLPFVIMPRCSTSKDSSAFCKHPSAFTEMNLSGKPVKVLYFIDVDWHLQIDDVLKNLSSEILRTNPKKLYLGTTVVPEIYNETLVDMKFVDSSWCWANTNANEYNENKPICEKFIKSINWR